MCEICENVILTLTWAGTFKCLVNFVKCLCAPGLQSQHKGNRPCELPG